MYNNSADGITTIVITGLECLNIYALLKHLLFPTSRGCAACQYDVRLTILGLIGATLWVLNMVVFFGAEEKQLPEPADPKALKRLVFSYIMLLVLFAQ